MIIQGAGLNISMFVCKSQFERAYQAVPLRRKQKIDRLKNEKDKVRSLAAEVVLNYCLLQYSSLQSLSQKNFDDTAKNIQIKNLTQKDIEESLANEKAFLYEMKYQQGGKPILTGNSSISFNLSHAGDYAVCAVANTLVGIDIEGQHKMNEKVMKRYFSEAEKNWVNENAEEKKERFFRLWTAKEALSKATGKGLSQIMEGIYFKTGERLTLENQELKSSYTIYESDSLKNEGYCITIAAKILDV